MITLIVSLIVIYLLVLVYKLKIFTKIIAVLQRRRFNKLTLSRLAQLEAECDEKGYAMVENKGYDYSIYLSKRHKGFVLSVPTPKVALGGDVLYTLTPSEIEAYFVTGIASLRKRISHIRENVSEYEIQHWR